VRLFPAALILLIAWTALAFGGSPTWAAAAALPLGIATAILGFLESAGVRATARGRSHRAVLMALALVLCSVFLQVVPLPGDFVARVSPARDDANYEELLAAVDRRDPATLGEPDGERRTISIVGSRTALGFAGLLVLAVFLLGTSRALSAFGARRITYAIAVLGVVVTLLGLYQLTSGARLVYGWYVPLFADGRSAPFINPNHQAGWLVMVMSLSLGSFAGEMARGMRGAAPGWRDRILWLSSKDANLAVLMLFAAAVMAVGILATRARSGALAMMLTFLIVAWWNSRRQATRLRRLAAALILIAVGVSALAFNGEAVLREIADTEGPGPRLPVWRDTLRIAGDFWLTGTGFNTYAAAMLRYQTVKDGFRYIEAHNEYLQLAAEGGLLVGVPFLVLAGVVVLEIRRRFRSAEDDTRTYWLRVGAVAGMIAIALQSVVEFTLQLPGGAVMFTTLLAIAIHHPPPRPTRGRDGG
jgi:O-antigen ligase